MRVEFIDLGERNLFEEMKRRIKKVDVLIADPSLCCALKDKVEECSINLKGSKHKKIKDIINLVSFGCKKIDSLYVFSLQICFQKQRICFINKTKKMDIKPLSGVRAYSVTVVCTYFEIFYKLNYARVKSRNSKHILVSSIEDLNNSFKINGKCSAIIGYDIDWVDRKIQSILSSPTNETIGKALY